MRRRPPVVRLALLVLALASVPAPRAGAVSGDAAALEPYRAFARSDAAPRLLALARTAMERHWSAAAGSGAAAAGARDSAAGARDSAAAAPAPRAARDSAGTAPIPWPGPPVTVYLSLAAGGATRACVGRPPSAATLSEAVAALAAEAMDADPRRPPLRRGELAGLRIVIAFAGAGEAIADPMLVDPAREGLSIAGPGGQVAFLPGEARTVAWALREARRAGVPDPAAGAAVYRRFPVVVISEPAPAAAGREDEDASP